MRATTTVRAAAVAAISAVLISLPAAAQGPVYGITFVGMLPGAFESGAAGISESGDVAGVSGGRAFLYHNGQLTDLGTLGGSFSLAGALNDSGQVVGASSLPGDQAVHAFLYRAGRMTDLGSLGGGFSFANGISQSVSFIVGESATSTGSSHAFLYRAGRLRDLGTLGGDFATAAAVNDSGQIVGGSSLAGDLTAHAFLISRSLMKDINPGIPGGVISRASAINQNGRVALFEFNAQFAPIPFVYQGGRFTQIKLPAGDTYAIPMSINDSGAVVGISGDVNGPLRAFLSQGSVTLDLNTVLPDLCFFGCPLGINDNGQIAGSTLDLVSFLGQAVVLTPGGGAGSQIGGTRASSTARSNSRVTWNAAEQKAGLK
jgi:probable HAF family extracellular repeat protein